jgi:hypothetical protein
LRSITLILAIVLCCSAAVAQSSGKYDFYRHPQSHAFTINPIGWLLGRVDAHYEDRLDPNFSRTYEIAYQRDIRKDKSLGTPEQCYTLGAVERIYLIDNAAIQGQFVGMGGGIGVVSSTIAVRLSAEIGYKLLFGTGTGRFFIEPELLLDSYVIGNNHMRRVLPYFAIPFGFSW